MKTLQQLSKMTGIKYETLKKRAQNGTLKAQKLGKTWIVSELTTNKLIKESEVGEH